MRRLYAYLLCLSLLFNGCGSLIATAIDGHPKIYEGIKVEAKIIGAPDPNLLLRIAVCFDFLPSCLMDTILLIYTGPCELLEPDDSLKTNS